MMKVELYYFEEKTIWLATIADDTNISNALEAETLASLLLIVLPSKVRAFLVRNSEKRSMYRFLKR